MLKKRVISMLCAVTTCAALLGGCGSSGTQDTKGTGDTGETEAPADNKESAGDESGEKPTVTLMIEIGGYAPLETAVAMVKEKFPEYNIISKEWGVDSVKQAIKTTFASGGDESIDIAFSASTYIQGFEKDGMLLDLNPYLEADPEWKESFLESSLSSCVYDGNTYGVPWQNAYPVLVANKDIFEEVGVEIKDDWNYDELVEVCEKMKEKGYYTLGIGSGFAPWLLRQSYLNGFENPEDLEAFVRGEIPATDTRVEEAFERVVSLYKNNYCYPGEGAIAVSDDECKAGMANRQIALFATTNGGVAPIVSETGVENWQIVNFPSISNYSTANLLGAPDAYVVPANAKNVDAVIEVLKYLTGEEVMTAMADLGTVVSIKDVQTKDPNYALYAKDMDRLHMEDFSNLSDEIGVAINSGTILTNYLFEGKSALEDLERIRQAAVAE